MEAGKTKEIALILKQYELPSGNINFPMLFEIPLRDRLPALYETDYMKTTMLVIGALTMCFEKLNLKKKDYGTVVNDIAEDVLRSSEREKLAMEDLMLFLQKLARGEYGIVEQISLARFNILLDKYLDERFDEGVRLRDERNEYYKNLGRSPQQKRDYEPDASPFGEQMKHYKQNKMERHDEMEEQKRYDKK